MQVELKPHAAPANSAAQFQIMIDGFRYGYVCLGKRPDGGEMPINWLPRVTIGRDLTIDERIVAARQVREQVAKLNAKYEAQLNELAKLSGGDVPLEESDLTPKADEQTPPAAKK